MSSRLRIPFAIILSLVLTTMPIGSASAASDDGVYAALWQVAAAQYHFHENFPVRIGCRKVTRVISIDIAAPREHVYEIYSDIDNHLGRHAFLQRVITHRETVEDGVHTVDFTAIENVPLVGGVALPTPTFARQEAYDDAYFYDSDTFTEPGVITHQRVTFTDLGNGRTRITENLTFEANFLLIDFTVTNGVAAHQATLSSFKAAFESGEI